MGNKGCKDDDKKCKKDEIDDEDVKGMKVIIRVQKWW